MIYRSNKSEEKNSKEIRALASRSARIVPDVTHFAARRDLW